MGKTYEKSLFPHIAFVPEDEPYSRHFPNRPQRPHLAQFARTNVTPWQERVQFHAAHLHFAAGFEAIQTTLAPVRAEEHQMDNQAASIGPWHRHQGGQPMDADSKTKTADCTKVSEIRHCIGRALFVMLVHSTTLALKPMSAYFYQQQTAAKLNFLLCVFRFSIRRFDTDTWIDLF